MLASVDGSIGPVEEARIPVSDEGLTRGDGGFEVMRLYGGRPFALEDHLARLGRTCAGLRLDWDEDALRGEIAALLDASGPLDALLRAVLTRGGRRILTVEPLPAQVAVARVATVTYAPNRVLDGLKTLSYAGNMLAGRLAHERGADEALLVTPHGRALEAPTSTLFWVDSDGALCTPPLDEHILASITRDRITMLLDVEERTCPIETLMGAGEAFLASTIREVQSIGAIEDTEFEEGPRTRDAAEAFRAHVEAELARAG
jgi:branched-chain amino acid aminotransferase